MARVLAVLGSKGGGGKSTVAHLLAHGAGSLPRPLRCIVVTTDPRTGLAGGEARRYAVSDGRTPARLLRELERLLPVERLLLVVDGAASSERADDAVLAAADLALVPFAASAQDAEVAAADLARLDARRAELRRDRGLDVPEAVALPNRWPTHPRVAARAQRWLEAVPPARRFGSLRNLPRVDGLLSADGYAAAAGPLSAPAQGLLLEVLHRAGVDASEITGG